MMSSQPGILAGGAIEWEYGMRREMQEIIPGIFLGPYACAMKSKLPYLQQHGITHIVCVRQRQEGPFVRPNFPEHFTYLVVELSDGTNESIIPHFPRVREFLRQAMQAGGRVLMHGNAGISRSGALLVSYMMEQYSLPYSEALRLIQMRRFCVSPNEGFQAQLLEYEPIYKAEAAARAGGFHNVSHRAKRGIDDTEYDDETDEMADRNPQHYPPAVELEPLPGHGAYVGPNAGAHLRGGPVSGGGGPEGSGGGGSSMEIGNDGGD